MFSKGIVNYKFVKVSDASLLIKIEIKCKQVLNSNPVNLNLKAGLYLFFQYMFNEDLKVKYLENPIFE